MYHTDAREYHCTLGRFIQVDPIGAAGGPNVYAYCNASPADTVDPSGLLDLDKVMQGAWGVGEGAIEILCGLPSTTPGTGNIALLAKGVADYALGLNKMREGFRDEAGLGAPANVGQAVGDLVSRLTGAPLQETRAAGMALDAALSAWTCGWVRSAGVVKGPSTYRIAPGYKNWNQFQAATRGQFASRGEAAKAWAGYKKANGIATGSVRNQAARTQYLKSLADDYTTPSWMKPWLEKGRVPPGYEVDHIKPLSIGGSCTPDNMRLQGADLHDIHHAHYDPWNW